MFYFLYLSGLLLRLQLSFFRTNLQLSRCSKYALWTLVSVVFILPNVFLIIDHYIHDEVFCIAPWNPPDIQSDIGICVVVPLSMLVFKYYIYETAIFLAILLNAIFCFILRQKLGKLIAKNDGKSTPKWNEAKNRKLVSLIAKISTITAIGCLTTLVAHIGWLLSWEILYVFLDYLIGCIVVGMMFSYNHEHYDRCCEPCTRRCCIWFKIIAQNDDSTHRQSKLRSVRSLRVEVTAFSPFSTAQLPTLVDVNTLKSSEINQMQNITEGQPLIDDPLRGSFRSLPSLTPLKSDISLSSDLPTLYSKRLKKSNDFQIIEPSLRANDSTLSKNFDLGMYLEYWRRGRKNYVSPKYRNLREELTMNKYANITVHQYDELVTTCERYLSLGFEANNIGRANEICNIDVASPITIEHLLVLKVYTDFDDVQREFKRHCRRLRTGDSLKSVMKRNQEIAIWSRLLRESVMFWGKTMTKSEELYCGLTARLVLKSLHQRFECPLSTTKDFDIAQRFTDECIGAIMRIKRASSHTRYFKAASISKFNHEEERLFIGSTIKIVSIFVFNGASGWECLKPKYFVAALAMFEQIYSGHFVDVKVGARTLLLQLLELKNDGKAAKCMFCTSTIHFDVF